MLIREDHGHDYIVVILIVMLTHSCITIIIILATFSSLTIQ